MGRVWAALTLAILAGCDDFEDEGGNDSRPPAVITVTIDNQGFQGVTARLEDWDGLDRSDLSVMLRWSASADVRIADRLKVHVFRDSDNALIFDDFWDRSSLEANCNRLTVTVYP